jgi:hypothetical protein
LNEKKKNASKDEYLEDEFAEWQGTNFAYFLISPKQQQTIQKIEPGGFRYVTVQKRWAETGLINVCLKRSKVQKTKCSRLIKTQLCPMIGCNGLKSRENPKMLGFYLR